MNLWIHLWDESLTVQTYGILLNSQHRQSNRGEKTFSFNLSVWVILLFKTIGSKNLQGEVWFYLKLIVSLCIILMEADIKTFQCLTFLKRKPIPYLHFHSPPGKLRYQQNFSENWKKWCPSVLTCIDGNSSSQNQPVTVLRDTLIDANSVLRCLRNIVAQL